MVIYIHTHLHTPNIASSSLGRCSGHLSGMANFSIPLVISNNTRFKKN